MRREDLPKDIQELVLKEIYATPKYMNLVATYQHHKAKGNMMQAMMAKKMMQEVEDNVFEEFFKQAYKTKVSMYEIIKDMNKEDQLTMNSYANGIMLLADVLDNIMIEMNQLVKRYKPDMKVVAFDNFNGVIKEAKKTVYTFDMNARDEYASDLFGITGNNLFQMIINKSKSFVKKLGEYEKKNKNDKKADDTAA